VLYQGHASKKHWMYARGSDAYLTLSRNGALKILDRSKNNEYIISKQSDRIDDSYSAEVTNDLAIVIKDSRGSVVERQLMAIASEGTDCIINNLGRPHIQLHEQHRS